MRGAQAGWFELQNMRDWYRVACGPAGMKRNLVLRFIEVRGPGPQGLKPCTLVTCGSVGLLGAPLLGTPGAQGECRLRSGPERARRPAADSLSSLWGLPPVWEAAAAE